MLSFRRSMIKCGKKRSNSLARAFAVEQLECRRMLSASDMVLRQNPVKPSDVNGDMVIAPGDALVLVNQLNRLGADGESNDASPSQPMFLDVNGDKHLTPQDVLRVVNALNAEGESGMVAVEITTR